MESKLLNQLNKHTLDIINLHFHPQDGTKFWLDKLKDLSFNPLKDIKEYGDLNLFPDFSGELRSVPIEDLIPNKLKEEYGAVPDVYESGGATGKPKRIIEYETRKKGVEWIHTVLDFHQFPKLNMDGGWLFVGPSGPHIVGTSMKLLAKKRGAIYYSIDFDPRWVRKCIKERQSEVVDKYLEHIIHQIKDIVLEQNIKIVFITPNVLEKVAADEQLLSIFQQKVTGLIWSGTSLDPANLDYLQTELLPDTKVLGLYGNTLMGIAAQRPYGEDKKFPIVFNSFFPNSIAEVVDFNDSSKLVDYYDRGQVKVTLLSKEMFIPNNLERDQAVRIPPSDSYFNWDGVAEVKPIVSKNEQIIEGVY